MSIKRKCDICGKEYEADPRNLKRGWGLCCSKSCAAKKREKNKPTYDKERVKANNYRRGNWNDYYMDRDAEEDGLEAMGVDFLCECGSRD